MSVLRRDVAQHQMWVIVHGGSRRGGRSQQLQLQLFSAAQGHTRIRINSVFVSGGGTACTHDFESSRVASV